MVRIMQDEWLIRLGESGTEQNPETFGGCAKIGTEIMLAPFPYM